MTMLFFENVHKKKRETAVRCSRGNGGTATGLGTVLEDGIVVDCQDGECNIIYT